MCTFNWNKILQLILKSCVIFLQKYFIENISYDTFYNMRH